MSDYFATFLALPRLSDVAPADVPTGETVGARDAMDRMQARLVDEGNSAEAAAAIVRRCALKKDRGSA